MCASDRSRPRSSYLLGLFLNLQGALGDVSIVRSRSRMISLASIIRENMKAC